MAISTIQSASLASGVPSWVNLPTGSILQVVSTTANTVASSTSSAFTSTGFGLTITPKFATSKILIIANLCGCRSSSNSGVGGQHTLYRNNATNLGAGGGTFACLGFGQSSATNLYTTINMTYLDSPATTSATTYTCYFATQTGTVTITDVGVSTFTLIEVAA